MRKIIDGAALTQMVFCASAALEESRPQLNDLNVFPVPDGDTGTNMSLTMSSAAEALRTKHPQTVTEVADATAAALLRGARGNSGVILSLLFRGIAKSLKGKTECDAAAWAKAMADGVDAAYKAVMKPAEGTILTVSRKAAERAREYTKAGGEDIEELLALALETAYVALDNTMELNPVLKKAGVVDAGGKGYIVIFDAMLRWMQGSFQMKAPAPAAAKSAASFSDIHDEDITFTYCTEFIVARETGRHPDLLRSYIGSIGDSQVMVEDDDIIKVHVHTDVPGKVLTEALKYGPLQTVKIENMRNQHTELVNTETATAGAAPAAEETDEDVIAAAEKPVGFVAVCAGEGVTELFHTLGADRVVTGGQTMNPSTQDILREIHKTPAETVFVFPNNKNIIMAAEQCIPISEKKVRVIPTKTVPQGIAALAFMDPEQPEDDMAEAFQEAADRVHTAQVTYAARDSEFDGHSIHAGEYLALLDGKLLGSYTNIHTLIKELSWAFGELEPEFLTIYYGEDVTGDDAQQVSDQLAGCFPEAEISLVNGGQPVYYYMIAAE